MENLRFSDFTKTVFPFDLKNSKIGRFVIKENYEIFAFFRFYKNGFPFGFKKFKNRKIRNKRKL